MMLKMCADFMNWKALDRIDKDNGMRIAHRDTGHLVHLAEHFDIFINNLAVTITSDRNFRSEETRLAHIHADARHFSAFFHNLWDKNTCSCLHLKFLFHRQLVIVKITRDAANAVAAHLRLTSVCIDDAHAEICLIRRLDGENAIGSDTITKFLRHRCIVAVNAIKCIEHDEIIAAALPFCKLHGNSSVRFYLFFIYIIIWCYAPACKGRGEKSYLGKKCFLRIDTCLIFL